MTNPLLSTQMAKVSRAERRRTRYGNLIFVPALLMLGGILYPFFLGVYYSLTRYRLIERTTPFIGLGNYAAILSDPGFWHSLRITLLYATATTSVEIVLGMACALLLNRDVPGVRYLRTLAVAPLMVPPVIAGLMWKVMMEPAGGILNYLLVSAGAPAQRWLASPSTALLSLVLIDAWIFTPFVALILLAGLQALPREPYEAALVDGASPGETFRYLTLPLLRPLIILAALFRLMDSIKAFDIIFATTRGGPINATMVLHIRAYEEAYKSLNMGRALALSLVLFILVYGFSLLLSRWWAQSATS
ncbi:MAG: sugar ABC transporter permease [Limnochordaceae bacterium]|nr:sugar ABC transporter permease [Limnochordaceae bacterium]